MTQPIAISADGDQRIEDDIKMKVFKNGKSIELSLHELPQSVQRTAYAILFSSYEF